jgi:ParB-like chromosome segregation protein Spo0J
MDADGVSTTRESKKYTFSGATENLQIYRIPVKYLYYNDKNDRIATNIAKYNAEHGKLISKDSNFDEYNELIGSFIKESNPTAMEKTYKSIKEFGQLEPGVVLRDGRIIDGNRRFTCLRKQQKEDKIEQFFNAAIIDKRYEDDEKAIKSLELAIQIAREAPVDYNPVDRLVGIHRDIREKKLFTEEEYSKITSISLSDVRKSLEKSDLMCEYLEFIEKPGAYHIARDQKLDGALTEIPAVLKKVPSEYRDDMKNRIFSDLLMDVDSDMTRYVREYKNIVKNPKSLTKFIEESNEVVGEVIDLIEKTDIVDSKSINDHIRTETDLIEKLADVTKKTVKSTEITIKKQQPYKRVIDAKRELNSIVKSSLTKLDETEKTKFLNELDALEDIISVLRAKFDA